MRVKSFVLAAGLLAVAGCAGNVSVPPPGPDHPANPRAAAAPGKEAGTMGGMRRMNHGSMRGMDHGSMKGMNHDAMPAMDRGSMKNAPAMKGMKKMEKQQNMDDMEGMHHAH